MASTPQTSALESWFKANGGYLHPNIRVFKTSTDSTDASSGIHYRATGPIAAGETIASSPHSLALSYLNAVVDDALPVFRQNRHRFKVENIGFWYLMTQYVNRERSFWKPYLRTLPRPDSDLPQPLFFEDPEDIAWLAGTDVWHTTMARRKVYEQYYSHGVAILREAGVDIEPYTWDLFRWAVVIFSSRSFSSRALHPEDSTHWTTYKSTISADRETVLLDMSHTPVEDLEFPVLFPGLDATNHNHESKIDWTYDPGQFSFALASSASAIENGSEVFNNYGPKGNGELLLGYGFCVPRNPHDTIAITLKRPPRSLQEELILTHPSYFINGEWNVETASFQLGPLPEQFPNAWEPFRHLPGHLIELLLYILRCEQGWPFEFMEHALEYLGSTGSPGRKYAPHVARMIFNNLSPKLDMLKARKPQRDPRTEKQSHASTYRVGQTYIHAQYVVFLKGFLHRLIWPHGIADPSPKPTDVSLLDVKTFHNLLYLHGIIDDNFLKGVDANANSTDFMTLWIAGWDEDLFVLLLCYVLISPNLHRPNIGWLREALEDYLPLLANSQDPSSRQEKEEDPHETENARELLSFARHAASVCRSGNTWADERWNVELVKMVGRQAISRDSFEIKGDIPASAMQDAGGATEMMRCFVCLYFAPGGPSPSAGPRTPFVLAGPSPNTGYRTPLGQGAPSPNRGSRTPLGQGGPSPNLGSRASYPQAGPNTDTGSRPFLGPRGPRPRGPSTETGPRASLGQAGPSTDTGSKVPLGAG